MSTKKNKVTEWVASIISLIGCILIFAPSFVESKFDLSNIGIGIVGIGIFIYLIFGNKTNAEKEK